MVIGEEIGGGIMVNFREEIVGGIRVDFPFKVRSRMCYPNINLRGGVI